MFWKKKSAVAPKMPEPTPEQMEEEQRMAEKVKRTTTGETTAIINLGLSAVDDAIEKKRETRQAAKKLKDSINQMLPPLQLKKV